MKRFEAVIFDMDGVIVDSEPLHERAFRIVFDEMGYGDSHGIDFPAYYGRSDAALWNDFIAAHCPPQSFEKLMDWKQEVFLGLLREEKPVFPRIPDLVERLAGRYRIAVASGSLHRVIDAVMELGGLAKHFAVRVSVQDVTHGKPAPDVFLRAAELLGVRPEKCCVIEDSAAGVQAALAAGMQVIGITNSLPAAALRAATHVVPDYEAIRRILD
jgi:HAD superfamily hydrolase (TIGR01509 family)